jgi:concentrative nucleoside transporter, CNT family
VASTVLGIYALFLGKVFPGVAGHLISASLIAIPAAVVAAKTMLPESGVPETAAGVPLDHEQSRDGSVIASLMRGAMDGVKLIVGIAAGLIALLAIVGIADKGLAAASGWCGLAVPLTLKTVASWPFLPLAALTGIAPADIPLAAGLLGERLILTEVPAFQDLARLAQAGAISDPRTVVIMSYALCGFAHVASVAIFIGGTAAIAPSRRDDVAALGFKALVAANLATLMTACIAGAFCSGDEALIGIP